MAFGCVLSTRFVAIINGPTQGGSCAPLIVPADWTSVLAFRLILNFVGQFHMIVIWGAEFDQIWCDMGHKPRDILNDPFENVKLESKPDSKVGSREQYINAAHSIS